jgi:hypothetical protein
MMKKKGSGFRDQGVITTDHRSEKAIKSKN